MEALSLYIYKTRNNNYVVLKWKCCYPTVTYQAKLDPMIIVT